MAKSKSTSTKAPQNCISELIIVFERELKTILEKDIPFAVVEKLYKEFYQLYDEELGTALTKALKKKFSFSETIKIKPQTIPTKQKKQNSQGIKEVLQLIFFDKVLN